MSPAPSGNPDPKMLPGAAPDPDAVPVQGTPPARQLHDMPKDELKALAEDFGLDATRYSAPQQLIIAIHERRQMIAAMDREAMLDVVRWGRRPVPSNASKEQLAQEIVKIKTMRFEGISLRGLVVLAKLRNARITENDDVSGIVRKLKKQEGFFAKLNRKRRSWLGSIVSKVMGEAQTPDDYQFLPPQQGAEPSGNTSATAGAAGAQARSATIKEEIEESGFFGGIAGRIKRSADSYINQKLDEIEVRLDRKLDEIDRRLGEWRDKEIANRIRILKITLWASVIIGLIALIYAYVRVEFPRWFLR